MHSNIREQKQKVADLSFAQTATDLSRILVFILGRVQSRSWVEQFNAHVGKQSSTWEDPQFASPGSCAW